MIAEGMPAVTAARQMGIIDLALLECGESRIGRALQHLDSPAKLDGIVSLLVRAVGTGEDLRPRARVQEVMHGRDRAVVQVRRGSPDSVQGRRLVAPSSTRQIVVGEPAALLLA